MDPAGPPRRWVRTALALTTGVLLIAGLIGLGHARRERVESERANESQIERLIRETAETRKLAFRRSVTPEFLSNDAIAREVRRELAEDGLGIGLPDTSVLEALGLVPEGTDVEAQITEASAASVIGFYDPETKRLVVESGEASLSPLGQTTMVHELTHAVTDQHFDLGTVVTGDEPEDELTARLSLLEGDATFAMGRWAQDHLSLSDQVSSGFEAVFQSLESAAAGSGILPELSAFPYVQGSLFVTELYERGGWATVDRAYRDPPLTTEEILHPERYLAGEDAPVPGRELVGSTPPGTRSGQVGELLLRLTLAYEGVASAATAAEGWDGGVWTARPVGGSDVLVAIVTHWDSEVDAAEFLTALDEWIPRRFAGATEEQALPAATYGAVDSCIRLRQRDALTVRLEIDPGLCL